MSGIESTPTFQSIDYAVPLVNGEYPRAVSVYWKAGIFPELVSYIELARMALARAEEMHDLAREWESACHGIIDYNKSLESK